ncbi:DUF2442 domain-containing protein [Inediibacterium massiliense]|uniref:DUF2442 domain-containing protein n=1 Tax=Inediibacterium massiliense TaxID=1658111 RepID=UPI0006B4B98C|nr:DUF2442 domain-containing protein [Inediibacterium massiliense]
MICPKIKNVKPIDNYFLLITFTNEITKKYDMKNWLSRESFKPLQNPALFALVKVDIYGYGISWNDEIDLSEYELWTNSINLDS